MEMHLDLIVDLCSASSLAVLVIHVAMTTSTPGAAPKTISAAAASLILVETRIA